MRLRTAVSRIGAGGMVIASVFAFQRPFRVYRSMEPYDDVALPSDYQEKSEWIFARLMYPQHPFARFGRRFYRWGEVRSIGPMEVPVGPRITRVLIATSPRRYGV
jgi:hypothetical protein